jgi:hypothetical protein
MQVTPATTREKEAQTAEAGAAADREAAPTGR